MVNWSTGSAFPCLQSFPRSPPAAAGLWLLSQQGCEAALSVLPVAVGLPARQPAPERPRLRGCAEGCGGSSQEEPGRHAGAVFCSVSWLFQ